MTTRLKVLAIACVVLLAIYIASAALAMLNQPSDAAVVGGCIVLALEVIVVPFILSRILHFRKVTKTI